MPQLCDLHLLLENRAERVFLHPNDRANDSPNSVAIVTTNTNEKATNYKSYPAAWLSEGGIHMPRPWTAPPRPWGKIMRFLMFDLCPKFFLRLLKWVTVEYSLVGIVDSITLG